MLGMLVIDIERCLGCKRCEIECAVAHSASKDLFEAIKEEPQPEARVQVEALEEFSAPLQCRHCEEAPCVAVCPSGALSKPQPENPLLLDAALCIGCKQCMIACPFGVIRLNRDGKAMLKCDLCVERLTEGEPPACARACLVGAIRFIRSEELAAQKRKKTLQDYLVTIERKES